jgi:hypothetical protein
VIADESLRQLDVAAEITRARDALTTVLTAAPAPKHVVTLDFADEDTYFVLTEALADFAAHQRKQANNDSGPAKRIRWAEAAEAALGRIETAAVAD